MPRFQNLQPTHHAGFRDMVRWMLHREPGRWEKWRAITPAAPPPRHVPGGALRATWVNHSTVLLQTENVNILTDPIWSKRCSPVSFAGPKRHHAPGIRFDDLPPIDLVLVSHNHYDHLDLPTLRRLKAPIVTGLGVGAILEDATELAWWQSIEISPEVRIHSVPAQHFSSRGVHDRDRTLWCGFVIETPHGPVYFAGDTGWGPHFGMIRERFGAMRLALLPIGAYRPEWFMCSVHISPQDAVRAAHALGAEVSIPIHYYTFHLGDDGQDEPADALRRALAASPDVRFAILQPGGTMHLEVTHGDHPGDAAFARAVSD